MKSPLVTLYPWFAQAGVVAIHAMAFASSVASLH
jgi:hypothetical protein